MNRRHRQCLIFVFLTFISTIIFSNLSSTRISRPSRPYRACIGSLIRSDDLVSLNKLMNMLNSLKVFFVDLNLYPIYLFHESTLTNETKETIVRCSALSNLNFYEISFDIPFASNRSGYASMCKFWSYDIWFKYQLVHDRCDYFMRFDDDSYLINSTSINLFDKFHREQLDFVYRVVYHDTNGLEFLQENLRNFLSTNQTRKGCIESLCSMLNGNPGYDGLAIYNNFFLIRVQLFYEYTIVKQYLEQLLVKNAFYEHRIGDANIQTISLLLIEKPLKIKFWPFAYNHNIHGSSTAHATFIYFHHAAFMWYFTLKLPNATCRKLVMATNHGVIDLYL